MTTRSRGAGAFAIALALWLTGSAAAQEVESLLKQIKSVGKEGKGNAAATKAWRELARLGPDALPGILAGMDDADVVTTNWIRAAVESIADRAVTGGGKLPTDKLEAFVLNRKHSGPARRLAYECLLRVDKTAPGRLLPGMLDDPGAELRRDAVAVVLADAQRLDDKDPKAAAPVYRKALAAARDTDQVKQIAGRLKKLGDEIDLTKHFGYITHWHVAGPFDNKDGVGYHTVFPPEKGVDLAATYKGKGGAEVTWKPHTTKKTLGEVDFNEVIGKLKGVTAFAFVAVDSPAEWPVELRAASNDAIKIYLNGKEVFGREEYHHGVRMDQHVGRGTLRKGRNEILVKVCQNEETESWTELWSFQLRVCDHLGGAVPLTVLTGNTAAPGSK
jgi:hypothetical protein